MVAHSVQERALISVIMHVEEIKKLKQLFANIALTCRGCQLTGYT